MTRSDPHSVKMMIGTNLVRKVVLPGSLVENPLERPFLLS